MFSIKITAFAFLVSTTWASALVAPESLDAMKNNADEKLLIEVKSFLPLDKQENSCVTFYSATALVKSDGEHQSYKPGEQVAFYSYNYDLESPDCQGFTGPTSPPVLGAGWCGLAYLNAGASSDAPLQLAAYGDSFEQAPGDMCQMGGQRRLALAPGTTDEMKKSADEKLLVQVDSVSPVVQNKDGCLKYSLVSATVKFAPDQKQQAYYTGDKVEFTTYSYDLNSSECQGFVGPASPQTLSVGWCGLAYLNAGTSPNAPLEIAAYGDSLEQAPADMCIGDILPSGNYDRKPDERGSNRMLRGSKN